MTFTKKVDILPSFQSLIVVRSNFLEVCSRIEIMILFMWLGLFSFVYAINCIIAM